MKKQSKLKKLTPFVLGTCMLTAVVSCGSDDDDNSSTVQPEQTQQDQQQEGTYRVVLTPVNANVAGSATGTAELVVDGDDFRAMVNVDGAPGGTHMQHIHVGTACPAPGADANGDGYVDAVEASAVTGGALIPFDSNLTIQELGGSYPSGENYDYDESANLTAMLVDLRLPDPDTNDMFVKLGASEGLNLAGRVVEVHGVPASTTLPQTVQGMDGMSPQQTLPILCGVIERVDVGTGTTTGGTGTTTGGTGTTTGGTGTTTGGTGTTTGGTGTTTGGTGTTTGGTGTTTGGDMGTTTGGNTGTTTGI